jgi:precorrin-3B methylase
MYNTKKDEMTKEIVRLKALVKELEEKNSQQIALMGSGDQSIVERLHLVILD